MNKFKKAIISAIRATVKQGQQSVSSDGGECAYRGCNGLRCTLGHMIDDNHYTSDLESTAIDNPLVVMAIINSVGIDSLSKKKKELLLKLQAVHDSIITTGDFVAVYSERIKDRVESGNLPNYILEGLKNYELYQKTE